MLPYVSCLTAAILYGKIVIPDKNSNLISALFSVSPAFRDLNDSCFSKICPTEANLQAHKVSDLGIFFVLGKTVYRRITLVLKMTGGAGHLLRVLPRLVLYRLRWHRPCYDRYEIAFPSKQLSIKYFMTTGISCVFLNTCNKLQFTIVDTYLTFARAVCIFNANQYNSQCHRYLINIYQALCNLISLYLRENLNRS